MTAYHVLAKVTLAESADQRHFFVRAKSEGQAIEAAASTIACRVDDQPEVQYTVKKAEQRNPPTAPKGTEIYSL